VWAISPRSAVPGIELESGLQAANEFFLPCYYYICTFEFLCRISRRSTAMSSKKGTNKPIGSIVSTAITGTCILSYLSVFIEIYPRLFATEVLHRILFLFILSSLCILFWNQDKIEKTKTKRGKMLQNTSAILAVISGIFLLFFSWLFILVGHLSETYYLDIVPIIFFILLFGLPIVGIFAIKFSIQVTKNM
jgi:hypothetical protein